MTAARAVATPAPAVAHDGGVHAVAPAQAPAEREADRFADSFAATSPGPSWSFGEVPVHAGDGARLGQGLEGRLGAALDADLSAVRLHEDGDAADLARRSGAEAVTIGHDIFFAPGKHQPGTREGARRLAHEVAHTALHADRDLLHRKGTAPVVPATTLAGLPEADRKSIQVVTTTPTNVTGLADKFATKKPGSASMTLSLPANTTVVADSSAATVDKHGLDNVAAALVTDADVSPPPLPENSTATIELDLSKHGGIKGLYRFTYHAPVAAKGATAVHRVLVEQLGAATDPAGQKPPEQKKGEPAPKDPVEDKIKAASFTHSYADDRLEALRAAVSEIPASHLAKVSGLKFRTASAHPTRSDVAGDYNQEKHTVTMYNKAFASAQNKYEQGTVATSYAARAIIHEIGHAIDLAPLRAAFAAYTSSGGGKAATAKLLAARSESGTRTVDKGGEFSDDIGKAAAGNTFRTAVQKDGRNVSKYAEQDWQESYAEAYSLYISSEDNLRLLRPATHAYFVKALPKVSAP